MAPSSANSSISSACRLLTSDCTGSGAEQKCDGHRLACLADLIRGFDLDGDCRARVATHTSGSIVLRRQL
jgi:hypothetical protein